MNSLGFVSQVNPCIATDILVVLANAHGGHMRTSVHAMYTDMCAVESGNVVIKLQLVEKAEKVG